MFSCFFSCFKPTIIEKQPNPIESFVTSQKEKFKSLNRTNLNNNIEMEFYDLKKYNTTVKEADNLLESNWKTRIFSRYTPKGVIYMHYDAYKQGFAYYCVENLPYRVSNSVAVDYVKTFHCYDFFMDENYYDDDYKHPLIEVFNPKPKLVDPSNNNLPNIKQGPFIQRKRKETKSVESKDDGQTPQKPKHQNKFIYLGHPRNMNLLKKPKQLTKMFNSPVMNSMKSMSWADYKASRV